MAGIRLPKSARLRKSSLPSCLRWQNLFGGALAAVVAVWSAGFDILYACLDLAFDREWQLYSIPQTFGVTKAVWISRILHSVFLLCMLALKWIFVLNAFYLFGVFMVGAFLFWGHSMRRPRVPMSTRKAFFDVSGLLSIFYFVAVAGGVTPATFRGFLQPS